MLFSFCRILPRWECLSLPQRVEFKTGHHCRNEVRDQCTHPVREYTLSIPDHCPEGRESSVPSWRGHIVPEKGDKDQDTPPLTPSVLAGILGMDAVLHRGSPSFRVNCRPDLSRPSPIYRPALVNH